MKASPLNYTGGKFRLLPQILPWFPNGINTFVDLFCGGCNVGINVRSKQTLFLDNNRHLIGLLQMFRLVDISLLLGQINDIIARYGLTDTSTYGYGYYGCDSSRGLANSNRESFLRLRNDLNKRLIAGDYGTDTYVMLYVTIVFSFNNQIRFNSSGLYNLPVGKRDFNSRMANKLMAFVNTLQKRQVEIKCQDFRCLSIDSLTSDDFVYVDPPYLITCATYNEQGGWSEADEVDLLRLLDCLTARGIRFALSNVLRSKGKENGLLLEWIDKNGSKLNVHRLHNSFSNSNYHTLDRHSATEEVLITNY